MTRAREPRSTYRLQIRSGFTLADAAGLVDYLDALGVDWVYVSPLLGARAGSDHGYDVVAHDEVDAARGGAAGLQLLSDAAHAAGLGVLADIVPNHVGVAVPAENAWWWSLLQLGPESPHAAAFDVDWDAAGGRLRIPVLGGALEEAAASGDLRVEGDELRYFEHRFPLAPGTVDAVATRADDAEPAGAAAPDVLAVHARQHYELVHWRRADAELNYRRFFAVNELAGIRVEDPAVFDASHAEIVRWVQGGLVDGLRVDHPDGLAAPGAYLDRLADDGLLDIEFRRLTGRQGPGAGRPSKLYKRSARVVDVTIPPRRYELAARILLDAIRRKDLDTDAVVDVAREAGREMGSRGLDQALIESGYEPALEGEEGLLV